MGAAAAGELSLSLLHEGADEGFGGNLCWVFDDLRPTKDETNADSAGHGDCRTFAVTFISTGFCCPGLYVVNRATLVFTVRFSSFISQLLLLAALTASIAGADPRQGIWAHERSELAPHPDVKWGQLENGFRYALLPHDGVPGSATLHLLVLAGAIDEEDNELGLAHFMEHMAFRGNKSFPENEMVRYFQELGIEFGSDINAVTAFDHTAYTLDFREASASMLQRGLEMFRSFASQVEFRADLLEQERGVILSELRTRDSLSMRGQMAAMKSVFDGLKFIERSPGGTFDSVKALSGSQFENFYRRYYRPDLMVLVGVGDFDAAEMAQLTREVFGDMSRPALPIPERSLGQLRESRGLRASTFRISDVGSMQVMIGSPETLPDEPDSFEKRVAQFEESLAMNLFNQRLQRRLMNIPGGSARLETLVGNRAAMAVMGTGAQAWENHLRSMDNMIRSTYLHGFQASEVQPERERQARMVGLAAELEGTRDPNEIAQALLTSIVEDEVFVGVGRELEWRRNWLNGLQIEKVNEAFRRVWNLEERVVHFSGDLPDDFETTEVIELLETNGRITPDPVRLLAREEKQFEMKPWGDPGTAELVGEVPEIGAKLYRLSNGVRVNIISTPYEPGVVHGVARIGSGLLDMPGNKPALKEFGTQTLLASGTAHYLSNDVREIIGSELLSFNFGVEDHDAFTFTGAAQTNKFDAFLGIVTDFLFRPKFGTYVHRSNRMQATMARASSSMGMQEGMRQLTDHLFAGDARFTWGNFVDYVGLSSTDVRRWMQEPLSEGYAEVSIVGDIDEAEAIDLVERTLGTLPQRQEEKKIRGKLKPLEVTAAPGFKRIEFVGEDHLSLVMGHWPVQAELSDRDLGALYILATLLENEVRDEIRQAMGLAYSPSADFQQFEGFSEFGMLVATVDCAAEESTRIARMVEDIAVDLSRHGIDEGSFIGARGILSSQVRRAWRDNSYLLSSIMRVQERPETVEQIAALHNGLIDDITREEVQSWANKVLTRRNTRTAAIVPKQFIGIFQTD